MRSGNPAEIKASSKQVGLRFHVTQHKRLRSRFCWVDCINPTYIFCSLALAMRTDAKHREKELTMKKLVFGMMVFCSLMAVSGAAWCGDNGNGTDTVCAVSSGVNFGKCYNTKCEAINLDAMINCAVFCAHQTKGPSSACAVCLHNCRGEEKENKAQCLTMCVDLMCN